MASTNNALGTIELNFNKNRLCSKTCGIDKIVNDNINRNVFIQKKSGPELMDPMHPQENYE